MAIRAFAARTALASRLCNFQSRGLQTASLPELPYDYSALEPAISGEIMQIHHQKHHQAYITNYNKALEKLDSAVAKGETASVVKLHSAIKFNGGGHVNHSIFWKNLAPVSEGGGQPPQGSLSGAIDTQYGSLEALIQKMSAAGAGVQGSGWVVRGMFGYNAIPQFAEENQLSRLASNSGTIVYNAMPQNNYHVDHNVQQPEQYHNYHQFNVNAFDQFSSFNRCAEGLPYYMPPASYCDLTSSSGSLEAMIGNNFNQTGSYGIKEESMLAPINPAQLNPADVNGPVYNFGSLPSLNPSESGMYYRC